MPTLGKITLSPQPDGDGIRVADLAPVDGTDTLIHTAPATGTTNFDEVWLWAYNKHTADVSLELKWGDTVDPIIQTIPFKTGLVAIVEGLIIGDGNTLVAAAAVVDVVTIYGWAIRRT
jgi:hypothetical protein